MKAIQHQNKKPGTGHRRDRLRRWATTAMLGIVALPAVAWLTRPADHTAALPPAPPPIGRETAKRDIDPRPAPAPMPAVPVVPARTADAAREEPLPATTATSPVAAVTPPPADEAVDAGAEDAVLFLSIVGDRTFYHWGRAGDRPPRLDPGNSANWTVPAPGSDDTRQPSSPAAPPAANSGPLDLGPAPQECPRTLPPGSNQADADSLRSQAGCRYLSSCSAVTRECTWHYQGKS